MTLFSVGLESEVDQSYRLELLRSMTKKNDQNWSSMEFPLYACLCESDGSKDSKVREESNGSPKQPKGALSRNSLASY